MNIIVVGLNHKTAPIEVREKFAFDGGKLQEAVNILKASKITDENVILSTCNRVEMYAGVKDIASGIENIKKFLSDFHNVPREALDKSLFIYHGRDAVRHIFRVASGLDSMVLGEPQILGQIKDAYDFSLKCKSTGTLLNKLMKKTVSVAKRTRTETGIGKGAVNISYAAVELAKKIFGDLTTKAIMLIGAGEMAELAARHLINNGVKDVIVANRTHERAEELAKEFQGRTVRFESLLQELKDTDIVICSTGAPNYILMKEEMHMTMKKRKQKPVFIIDISVPRNIDPEIDHLDNVYLYNTDDLQGIIDVNADERKIEAEKASEIVESEVETFMKWQASLSSVPTIVALREKAEAIKNDELEKALKKLGPLGESQTRTIEHLASSIVNKIIHGPTAALKSAEDDKEIVVDVIRRLFDLEGEKDNGQS
ncbi:MAG: glutamyl-tRNA reductase [Thermodesulfovibrionia bacterium]|nr:glutamyl-tRNA reductase [Thermodesulfovibrionia bacterium]